MMSPFDRIELIADQSAARYRSTLDILRNQETAALMTQDATTPAAVRALKTSLERIGDIFLTDEEEKLRGLMEEMFDLAHTEAARQMGDGMRLSAQHIDTFLEFGVDEIEAQLVRDVAQIIKHHRKRGIEAQMRANARGLSVNEALMEIRIEGIGDRASLWFTDRAGRRIASQKHMRRFYRALMRDGYLSALASLLALRGADSARIVHPDPSHKSFGEIVRLDGAKPDLSSYESVFHPNSQATLLVENLFQEKYT